MQQYIQDYLNRELNQKIKISINRLDIKRTNRFQSEIKALEQKLHKLPSSTNIKIKDPSDGQFVSSQMGNEKQHLSLPKKQNIRYLMDTNQKRWLDNIKTTNEQDQEINKFIYKGKFPLSNSSVKRLNLLASQELSQLASGQDQGTQYLVRGKQLDFSSEASYSNLKSIFSVSKGYYNIDEKETSSNAFEFPPIKTPQPVEPKLFSSFEKKSYRSNSEQQKQPPQSSITPYQFQPIAEVKEKSKKSNNYLNIKNLRKRCEEVLQNSPDSTRSPILSPLTTKNSQKTAKINQSLQDRFGKVDYPLSMNRIVQFPGPADYDGDYYSMNRRAQKHRENSTYKRQLQEWLQNYDK